MKTIQELNARQQQWLDQHNKYSKTIYVCGGTSCSSGNEAVYDELLRELERNGLNSQIEVIRTGCHGLCGKGPVMTIEPDGITYAKLEPDHMEEIVEDHLIGGKPVNRLVYVNMEMGNHGPGFVPLRNSKFWQKQNQVIIQNCGVIDPEEIDAYIGMDGYKALGKALSEMKPEDVRNLIIDSGLRGRGGAGYLTGKKWDMAAQEESEGKYVFCNADEGDQGAYMDRSILEANPHAIIEGLTIAGYAVGAGTGYVYIRPEYTVAVKNLEKAIEQARNENLLGTDILGSGFDFDIRLRFSAGGYVSGEETAIMSSFVQNRGEPQLKLVYPSQKGLYQKPTVVNNVETLATVPQILRNGADWFAGLGIDTCRGTKIFALGGNLNNTGLVEVPMGTTLRTLVEDVGGGVPYGKKLKAIQTGGASGGYIPASLLDVEMEYDKLKELGTLMGAGGLMALDEDTCIVDNTRYQVEFSAKESCGKCSACRLGTKRMLEILETIIAGKAEISDLEKLEQLAKHIKDTALCGLGKSAPNPVLSSLRYFRKEYEAHIKDSRCEAGVCKALVKFVVEQEHCEGCGVCAASCPSKCISERQDETKLVDNEVCIACGVCMDLCPVRAIHKE